MRLNVNGNILNLTVDSDTPLLGMLRDHLGLTGTKFGCGLKPETAEPRRDTHARLSGAVTAAVWQSALVQATAAREHSVRRLSQRMRRRGIVLR
jgi:hypothetical protein